MYKHVTNILNVHLSENSLHFLSGSSNNQWFSYFILTQNYKTQVSPNLVEDHE